VQTRGEDGRLEAEDVDDGVGRAAGGGSLVQTCRAGAGG
jgi:hypothetical protein